MDRSRSGIASLEFARRTVASVLRNDRVHSLEALSGGATNSSTLIRLERSDDLFVLRTYLHGAEVCQKETALLHALRELIPRPELVKSDPTGQEVGTPYLIYRYVPGLTFRQIRAHGSPREMADAAYAVGKSLGTHQNHDISLFSACGLVRSFDFDERELDSPVLRELIGPADFVLLQAMFAQWSSVLRPLAHTASLVHGDFNHRNVVLDRKSGGWELAAILDWELAGIGSPLWDAARFMCYRKPDSHHWESSFIAGYRASSSREVPEEWADLACAMNTLSAAASLAGNSVREQFVPELKQLVHCGLRGERIG